MNADQILKTTHAKLYRHKKEQIHLSEHLMKVRHAFGRM